MGEREVWDLMITGSNLFAEPGMGKASAMSESPSSGRPALERVIGLAWSAAFKLEFEDGILGESAC